MRRFVQHLRPPFEVRGRALVILAVVATALALAGPSSRRLGAAPDEVAFLPVVGTALTPPGDRAEYVRFAALGDYGIATDSEARVAALIQGWNPGFVITLGDNIYGNADLEGVDERIGRFYAGYISPYRGVYGRGATSNHFYPTLGNHDWSGNKETLYLSYFTLPGNERYYDFVRGPVHFFALDSDPNEPDGVTVESTQAQWLRRALAASTSCWNLVYFHHPPFSSGEHGSNPWMQWPFRAWGADAVLSGHEHLYERLDVGGLPYIVNGLGGAGRYSFRTPVTGSVVRYNGDFGALLVEATRTSVSYRFFAADRTLVDTYTQQGGCG